MQSIRELTIHDIDSLVNYWFDASPAYLAGMGVDVGKMPGRDAFAKMLLQQLETPVENRKSFCLVWELDGAAVGHCNTNPTFFGEKAYMHLHLWKPNLRQNGNGLKFVRLSVPVFFDRLKLKRILCQPYALNTAPNRVLEKAGFRFVKEYTTTPGSINFEQRVKLWELTYHEASRM